MNWHQRRGPNPLVLAAVISASAVALLVSLVAVILVRRAPEPVPAAEPVPLCGTVPTHATRELRGMTLTTVLNIDWPSSPGLPAQTVRSEYLQWLDLAVAQRHNSIFVHIRPSGDAFWPSEYAPWSEWLTGNRSGADPGWDPLAFMIEEAHARNLEFYGWVNPYRGGQPGPLGPGGDINNLAPNHPLRAHPEWAIVYPVGVPGQNTSGSRLYFDPGNPEARRFVEDSILEAVAKYDLDGVFLDDYFYPYVEPRSAPQEFGDDASYALYGGGLDRNAWRRSNVDTLVRELSERVKELKPWVKFGISPGGIWRNQRDDPAGSDTAGGSTYDELHADSRAWVRNEWVDFIMPQIYWHIGKTGADYAKLVPWWSQQIEGTRVHLYTAHADYRIGDPTQTNEADWPAWSVPGEIDKQLAFNRDYPVSGSVHYTAHSIRNDLLGGVTQYRDAHYAAPALVPTMAHLPAAVPGRPLWTSTTVDTSGAVTLRWRPGGGPAPASYAIYRYGPSDQTAELVATMRATGGSEMQWVDTPPGAGPYGYCVSGLDRSWNEGAPSSPAHPG